MKNLEKFLSLLDGEVDGLLLTSRYSRHYGAEFDIAEGMAIVTKKGCRYFTDSRYIESAQANIKGFEVLDVNSGRNYAKCLNEAIADFGVTALGYEENYLTVAEFMGLEKNLNAKLVPFNAKINGFRDVKEDWELDLLRKAQKIADKALKDTLPRIHAGMTELEAQAELIYEMYKNGAQGLSFDPIVVSGPNTSMPHGVAGERVIQEGDFITMDYGAVVGGYHSDMTRTVAVGSVSEEQKKIYNTVLEAQLAAMEKMAPGVSCADADKAARDVITDAGYGEFFGHVTGHGVGVEIHDHPRVSPRSKEILAHGHLVTAEPGIYLPGLFGVRIVDMVLITEDGSRGLTHAPKELIIL